MPREAVILSPIGVNLEPLMRAAGSVDAALGVRSLYDGAALQLLDADGDAVLTVQHSTLVTGADEVARLLPGAQPATTPTWWTDAVMPWRGDGLPGRPILEALAVELGGVLVWADA